MQIDLTSDERRMILVTLTHPVINGLIRDPATPQHVRDIYKGLLLKIKSDEDLHNALAATVQTPRLLIPQEREKKNAVHKSRKKN